MRPQQTVPDIYEYARHLAAEGATERQIVHLLCAQGLHEESAREMVQNMNTVREGRRQDALRQWLIGLGISLGVGVVLVLLFGTRLLWFAILVSIFVFIGYLRTTRQYAYIDRWVDRRR